jgi:integrase
VPSAVADFGAWPGRVSQHALQQAAERAGISSRATLAEQVSAALKEGRVAAQRPPWLDHRARNRPGGLYAWNRSMYTCRHTFASWSIAGGVPLFYLSRVMGTSIAQIDATYGHLVPDSEEYLRGLLDSYDAQTAGVAAEQ